MELVGHGEDPKDDRTRRSHLGLLVTRRVNKIVLLPVLKDHGSAGVTGALKNMSHGLVNNVYRSHSTPDTNVCNQFIPQVVSPPDHPQEVRPAHHGRDQGGLPGRPRGLASPSGPGRTTPSCSRPTRWRWTTSLWRYIDAKRKEKGLPPVGAVGQAGPRPAGHARASTSASPSTSALAANLGLGIFDFNSPRGRRFSIDHKILSEA